jgi:N-acetyl-gamma-glutamyl-phosphate reductase
MVYSMDNVVKTGIVGAAGYTGGELIRLLLNHPNAALVFAHSKSSAGKYIYETHRDLIGETQLVFAQDTPLHEIDVLFLCLGHDESKQFLAGVHIPDHLKIIDLSQDFRLQENAEFNDQSFVYGLPELNRDRICSAKYIANPGCFATAIQLSLLPMANQGYLPASVHITGITGATGAGQQMQSSSHFPWRVDNISAYKTLQHQHLHEIKQSLAQFQQGDIAVHFVPWRGDFARGIFVSTYMAFNGNIEQVLAIYTEYYQTHPFVGISPDQIDMKQAVNTNKCMLQLEVLDGQLVIHAAIDNLLKGASGQAVQNMNLMFGLEEKAGLHLKGSAF